MSDSDSRAIVFFDLETGGLAESAAIIQIGAVAAVGFEEVDAFEVKIDFDESVAEPQALALNSYNADVWKAEAVPLKDGLESFSSFLRKYDSLPRVSKAGRPYRVARLAGHNAASFDAPRLVRAYSLAGLFMPADCFRPLDTLQLALWHFSGCGVEPANYKLETLAEWFGHTIGNAHDALDDARASLAIARAIIGRASGAQS